MENHSLSIRRDSRHCSSIKGLLLNQIYLLNLITYGKEKRKIWLLFSYFIQMVDIEKINLENTEYYKRKYNELKDRILTHLSEEELHNNFNVEVLTSTTPQIDISVKKSDSSNITFSDMTAEDQIKTVAKYLWIEL